MKLTKQKLFRLIQEQMLHEAAKGIQDIPEGYHAVCMKMAGGFQISLDSEDWGGGEEIGFIQFQKIPADKGKCSGGMGITMSSAKGGWGPFLYDLVMEKATIESAGIIPDRSIVSPAARGVWEYYLNNRKGVVIRQLDNYPEPIITPEDPSDDCSQVSSQKHLKWDWQDSPLSKIYSKEPTTIEALKKLGKWTETK